MDDTITVEFTPGREDGAEAQLYAYSRSLPHPVRFALEYGAAIVVASATAGLRFAGAIGIFETVIGMVAATACAAAGPRVVQAVARRRFTPHAIPEYPSKLTFSPGGVTFHSQWGDSRFNWFRVNDVVANGRATIIDFDEAGTCVVPLRAFSSFDEYRTFAGVLQTWHFEAQESAPPAAMRV